ncbi:MAG: VanZ family protein [Alicyclobacillus sp.]|nr:VanZ family protein [Alicyclobacillus sp.]
MRDSTTNPTKSLVDVQRTLSRLLHLLVVLIWACILGYFIFSAKPFSTHLSSFHFTTNIRWRKLLIMDLHFTSQKWCISKVGHFLGFLTLDVLLFQLCRRRDVSAWIAILFGISTEFSQLFFGRDGRLYDMIIDSLGVALSYYIQSRHQNHLE